MPANTTIQFRRGPTSEWISNNPILASGEPGYDISLDIIKIGDGGTTWNDLPVFAHANSGVSGYNAKWSDTYSLSTGIIYDSGDRIGILTDTPAYTLDINGSLKSSSLNINNAYSLPTADGFANQVLQTDGNGNTQWATVAGGSSTAPLVRGYEILSENKTVFTTEQPYISGNLDVYQNGIKLLINDDYTANGGSSFTLTNPAISGDTIEWITGYAGGGESVQSIGSGTVNYMSKWNSNNTLTTGIIYDTGDKVGIGTSTPSYKLHVLGSGSFAGLRINNTYSLPIIDGTTNQYLKTDGAGNLSWSTVSGVSSSATEVSVTGSSTIPYANISGAGSVVVSLDGSVVTVSGSNTGSSNGFVRGYEIVSVSKSLFDIGGLYASGNLDVYYNGFKLLINDDYTANGGSTFTLTSTAVSGDIVEWIAGYTGSAFVQSLSGSGVSNYLSKWNTTTGLTSGLIYDNSSGIGIGTSSPTAKLHIVGDCNIDGDLTVSSVIRALVNNGNSGATQTVNLNNGSIQTYTLTNNCSFTMPSTVAGQNFRVFLNTGTGGHTATFSGVLWLNSIAPTITTTASKVDILDFVSDGSYWYGSYSQNYG